MSRPDGVAFVGRLETDFSRLISRFASQKSFSLSQTGSKEENIEKLTKKWARDKAARPLKADFSKATEKLAGATIKLKYDNYLHGRGKKLQFAGFGLCINATSVFVAIARTKGLWRALIYCGMCLCTLNPNLDTTDAVVRLECARLITVASDSTDGY